jgi:uncharacterized protein (TIGR00251 family)
MEEKREYKFRNVTLGAALHIRVTPRAKKNEITDILQNGIVKIRLTAPPVDGKANKGLIDFLSKALKVRTSDVEIIAGNAGRDKIVSFTNIQAEELERRIREKIV